jgi:hypothetical protein
LRSFAIANASEILRRRAAAAAGNRITRSAASAAGIFGEVVESSALAARQLNRPYAATGKSAAASKVVGAPFASQSHHQLCSASAYR